jgi:kumamolisin
VAPLWAALIALLNQSLGSPLGFARPRLYAPAQPPAFRDITSGNNGAYDAGSGWDACTGLGSPNGAALLAMLQAGGSAG